ncbi:hypothetical protein KKG22_00910 [Patescibacteria group bacterium]|nr:hypothetical protein [Patescibacteria group bacterium]MBU1721995.1 hypothetical protein [Patescibacteria group bacterium]MBU1901255.1 hypothetical protein [Patescibacteria group bacterium]
MATKAKGSNPKLFFLHLLSILALYVSAGALITVLFQLINIYIPDTLNSFYDGAYHKSALRSAISFLIVMFPVYIGTLFTLDSIYKKEKETRDLAIRKWLVYFTMFVGVATILFTLVSVFNTFLDGEMTLRFALKVLSVLFVAGSTIGYYFYDLKRFKS